MASTLKGAGFCPYVAQKFQHGLQQRLTNAHVHWDGIIPKRTNVARFLTFSSLNKSDGDRLGSRLLRKAQCQMEAGDHSIK